MNASDRYRRIVGLLGASRSRGHMGPSQLLMLFLLALLLGADLVKFFGGIAGSTWGEPEDNGDYGGGGGANDDDEGQHGFPGGALAALAFTPMVKGHVASEAVQLQHGILLSVAFHFGSAAVQLAASCASVLFVSDGQAVPVDYPLDVALREVHRPPPTSSCTVTLDLSLLISDHDMEHLAIDISEVPTNTTAGFIASYIAEFLGVPESDVGMLRDNMAGVNPMSTVSAFAHEGSAYLRLIPRDRVGGVSSESPLASNPRNPGRRRVDPQPPARARPGKQAARRWLCAATVEQQGTGKNTKWSQKGQEFEGPTEEDVLRQREEWIEAFLHPKQRAPKSGKRFAPDMPRDPPAGKRAATPESLAEPKSEAGPSKEQARAGPGRGHTAEAAGPSRIEEPVRVEEMKANANWFEQAAARKAWQTRRIEQLEQELFCAHATIACQEETIAALRSKVDDLQILLQTHAEEIVSHLHTEPILKQAAHAKALEEHPEWKEILGAGYREDQRRSLMYQHLQKLLDYTRGITGGDPMKAKQLIDLLHSRAHAGEHRISNVVAKAASKAAAYQKNLNEGIVLSLRSFVHALHDAGGSGRYPDKIRQAMQVVATAVSKASMIARVPIKDVGDALGLDARMISKCKERFDALKNDGEWETLFDDRGAIRSDTLPEDWIKFASMYWTEEDLGFVRRSEKMSDAIRNPDDRKAPKERLFTLEARIGDMYEAMKTAGKEQFGSTFHVGMTKFRELRPFYVKDATRETCMCIYHLRWTEMANALLKYRQTCTCRAQGVSTCSCNFQTINDKWLRKGLCCQRDDGSQTVDNTRCVTNSCADCKDAKRLTEGGCGLCEDELRDPGSTEGKAIGIRYEKYTKIQYLTKDGTLKEKKDFRTTESIPISEFVADVRKYWPKYIAHHNDARWLDEDWVAMKKDLPCGSCVAVMDFAENYAHEPRYEHQSKYFSQTQTTILPVVLRFRIEDMTNLPEPRKAELLAFCAEHKLPPVLVETHFVISNDMQHDNAFVQKALDDWITPYIKRIAPSVTKLHVRSDGCKAQFKCAEAFDWTSRQSKEGCGLKVYWSFFESCHGKCDCDPEGGTLKNAARHAEMSSKGEHLMKTSDEFFTWASSSSGLHTPTKSFEEKSGRGIFRRFFYFIPVKGPGSVNRVNRKKFDSAKGSSQLHEFVDIGVPGTVQTRRGACHQCSACWRDERRSCEHANYVGQPKEMPIRPSYVPTTSNSRVTRQDLDRDAKERAASAAAGSYICIETAAAEKQVPWVLAKVLEPSHEPDAAALANDVTARSSSEVGIKLDVARANDAALKVQLLEPIDAGSSTFTLTKAMMLIPARRVRVVDLGLTPIIPRASPPVPPTLAWYRVRRGSGTAPAPAPTPAPAPPPPPTRFKLLTEGTKQADGSVLNGLHEIRAEMPSVDDSWDVDAVVQYRTYYRKEQWLIKWKGYDEDRNTWEPWENLLEEWVQEKAKEVKQKALEK